MKHPVAFWVLALLAFLAPLIGGGVLIDPQPADNSLLLSLFGAAPGVGMSFGILGLLAGLAVLIGVFSGRVVNLPKPKLVVPGAVFLLLLWASIGVSDFKVLSLQSVLQWTCVGCAVLATIMLAGISTGPRVLSGAMVAGVALVSVYGIREFAEQRVPDWRIFSTWFHPNALAGMLAFGVLLGIGLAVTEERVPALLAGLASALSFAALMLTGSKGGLLALVVGLAVYAVLGLAWIPKQVGRPALTAIVVLVLGFGMATGLRAKAAGSVSAGAVASRVTSSGGSSDQSVGFRQLLWRSSLKLMQTAPAGTGMGTFRHHSARPGLNTATYTAHNSFLQLGVEAGPAALVFFIAGLIAVLVEGLKGSRKQPPSLLLMKMAVGAAIAAAMAHNIVDSDWFHMGAAVAFAICVGLWVSLSADSVAPEFARAPVRPLLIFGPLLAGVGLVYFGALDWKHSLLQAAFRSAQTQDVEALLAEIKGMGPVDGRVAQFEALWAQRGGRAPDVELLKRAVSLAPTTANWRSLARAQAANDQLVAARASYRGALDVDPNNLPALRGWLEMEKSYDPALAKDVALRLVTVESRPYFQIRALPELVPTETAEARLYLASLPGSDQEKVALLAGALELFSKFAEQTVPTVVRFSSQNMDGGYGGITKDDAMRTMAGAKRALDDFKKLGGNSADVQRFAAVLEDAEGKLLK